MPIRLINLITNTVTKGNIHFFHYKYTHTHTHPSHSSFSQYGHCLSCVAKHPPPSFAYIYVLISTVLFSFWFKLCSLGFKHFHCIKSFFFKDMDVSKFIVQVSLSLFESGFLIPTWSILIPRTTYASQVSQLLPFLVLFILGFLYIIIFQNLRFLDILFSSSVPLVISLVLLFFFF